MDKLEEIFSKYAESHAREVPARAPPEKVTGSDGNSARKEKARVRALKKHLSRKVECDKRALEAVESMLLPGVHPAHLVNEADYICQYHFDDVTEERAYVEKLCGYPVCSNPLERIRPQDYYISGRAKAIFDVKERKKYCSLTCFRAAEFYKSQLETSPVWLREHRDQDTCSFAEKKRPVRLYDSEKGSHAPKKRSSFSGDAPSSEEECEREPRKPSSMLGSAVLKAIEKQKRQNRSFVDSDDEPSEDEGHLRQVSSVQREEEPPSERWVDEAWACIESWLSTETLLFLCDDNFDEVRQRIRIWRDEAGVVDFSDELLDRSLRDLKTRKNEAQKLHLENSDSSESHKNWQPVDEVTAAKIRAFYSGQFVFETPAPKEAKKPARELGNGGKREEEVLDPDEIPVVCPVLPEKNPALVRRKIFAEKISGNGMRDLCRLMDLPWLEHVDERLSGLSKTLSLTSSNICLSSRSWRFAAVVVLRLLKECSEVVRNAWEGLAGAVRVETCSLSSADLLAVDSRLRLCFLQRLKSDGVQPCA